MTAQGQDIPREPSATQLVADFLAAFALFAGILSVVYYPGRVGTGAVLIALLAAGLGGADRRLVPVTVAVTSVCWLLGMALAVILERPIF